MKRNHRALGLALALALVAPAVAGALVLFSSDAAAQSLTAGAIQGVVKDKANGQPLAGVTVVVSSESLQGTQTAITDSSGFYKITNLPTGVYTVTFFYSALTVRRNKVYVSTNKTAPVFISLDVSKAGGEVIEIEDRAPAIDPTTTNQGATVNEEYLKNIPVPGRRFDSALGAAAGSINDGIGVSFSGSTSLENQYVVDGVNTTGLTFGNVGSAVLNDFIEEIEVITGGYQAEYGRATGAFVNVVTKTGSNEFKGDVFTYFSTDFLTAEPKRTFNQQSSIESNPNVTYDLNFGFDLGGPIIKDKLWFFVGFSPTLVHINVDKITKRRADCRTVRADGSLSVPANRACTAADVQESGDGSPDEDPNSGLLIFEELDRTGVPQQANEFQFVSKLNYTYSPEHQGQLTFSGTPSFAQTRGVAGDPSAISREVQSITADTALKWNSKFNNSKTEIEGVFGFHYDNTTSSAVDTNSNEIPRQNLVLGDLGVWAGLGHETERTAAGCRDSSNGANDLFPNIPNCPDVSVSDDGRIAAGSGYAVGGIGGILDLTERRITPRVSVKQRLELLGSHEFKAGADVEDNFVSQDIALSGGALYSAQIGNAVTGPIQVMDVARFVQLAPPGSEESRFNRMCSDTDSMDPAVPCDFNPPSAVETGTFNWAAFIQDSWRILPNLTVNAGLRYEEQRLEYAEHLRGLVDPLTGDTRGKNAMTLNNMWAPRLGALYDFTREGRSKVYGHYGRFYESIPLNLNTRSFGGETFYFQRFAFSQCGARVSGFGAPDGNNCTGTPAEEVLNASGVLVQPGVEAQYVDEFIVGGEYEVYDDIAIGLVYRNRALGRALEDVSTDGADTFILANPGEFSRDEERKLQSKIDRLPAGDAQRALLEQQLAFFQGVRQFDKARRDYWAIEVTGTIRPTRDSFINTSYTYSRTEGNYPGLFSADNGQIDPNISSQFDLIELLANRDGPLPQDRRHQFKLDGFKRWDLGERYGTLITGARLRLLTGTPVNALGRHHDYGFNESFLLPRGAAGRTDFTHSLDFHLSWGRKIGRGMTLEVFADAFRVFNNQDEFFVDQSYTLDNANPIVGGTTADLVYLKRVDDDGNLTADPVRRNRNFGNVTARFAPFSTRLGARLTF